MITTTTQQPLTTPNSSRTVEIRVDQESPRFERYSNEPFGHTKYRKGLPVEVNGVQFASMKHLKDYSYYLVSMVYKGVRLDNLSSVHFRDLFKLSGLVNEEAEDLLLWKTELPAFKRRYGTVSGLMYLAKSNPDIQFISVSDLIDTISRKLYPHVPSKIKGMIKHLGRYMEFPDNYTSEHIARIIDGEKPDVVFGELLPFGWFYNDDIIITDNPESPDGFSQVDWMEDVVLFEEEKIDENLYYTRLADMLGLQFVEQYEVDKPLPF